MRHESGSRKPTRPGKSRQTGRPPAVQTARPNWHWSAEAKWAGAIEQMKRRSKPSATDRRPKPGSRFTRTEPPPPVPETEWPPEVLAAWRRLTDGLQPLSRDEIAKRRALLTAPPPRKRKQLSRDERIKLLYEIRKKQNPAFNKLTPTIRRAVLMVDVLEDEGVPVAKMAHKRLHKLVTRPEAPVGTRALAYAKTYRRKHPR